MTDRRTFLATAGTGLAAMTAGCGVILGNEPATFTASAAAVPESTLQQTGYEFVANENMEIEREFSVAGQSRQAIVTNVLAKHERSVDLGPLGSQRAAVFTALTTPKAEVLGETFNPVAEMSATDLAEMAQDQYQGVDKTQQQRTSEVTINGTTTTQAKFGATTTFAGTSVDVALHVSEAVELGSDFLVTFGGYPQRLSGEEENIIELMESVGSA
jgi:hypothetical protein